MTSRLQTEGPVTADLPRRTAPARRVKPGRLARFRREEDGSLIIFSLFIFVLMLFIAGISVDIERFEAARTKLQNTADAASLAAASLSQEVSAEVLVRDYFAKAGMDEFIENITVDEAVNFKRVFVDADINVPTHFFNMAGIENLATIVDSMAEESIGDVEISLVLDVSGSMGSNSKLSNLKVAAGEFIDSIYENGEEGAVSTSIVPYSTQVSAGPEIMSYLNRTPVSHDRSYCLNFSENEFTDAAISTTGPVEQTLHFDAWTNQNSSWDADDPLWQPVCPTSSWTNILTFQENIADLKAYINAFQATNWTSIELGVKWGSALLDPEFRPVVSGMAASGDVPASFADRPLGYDNAEGLKVMVVMTDGVNTEQYQMKNPYRTNDSYVYVWYDQWDRPYFSIWGGEGEILTEVQYEEVTTTDCVQWNYYYSKNGKRRWYCSEYQTTTETVEAMNWYLANDYSSDGVSPGWRSTPMGMEQAWIMTWDEVWAEVPVDYFADRYLVDMGGMNDERTAIKNALVKINQTTKDARTRAICAAAKEKGVLIYSIGFEAPYDSQVLLKDCATTPSHYFNVSGTDISLAFSAIAADINRLRLVQ